MDRTPQLFTAEDIEALGDEPLFFRNMWSAAPSAAPPPSPAPSPRPSISRPVEAPPRPASEAPEPRGPAARPYLSSFPEWDATAAGAPSSLGAARHRRPRKARRWPLALAFGTALGAGIAAVFWLLPELLLPPSATVPPREAARLRPASPALTAGEPTPPSSATSTLAPVPRPGSPAPAAPEKGKFPGRSEPSERLKTAAVVPATPPAGASKVTEPLADVPPPPADASLAAAPTAAADPPAAPNGARTSNPLLALALLRRAEDALARQDIATARAFYIRAATVDPWSIEALTGAGRTYDAEFLSSLGVRRGLGDPAEAQRWYDRAARLSDPSASPVLAERPGDDGR